MSPVKVRSKLAKKKLKKVKLLDELTFEGAELFSLFLFARKKCNFTCMEEIVNKVAQSGLISVDLEQYLPAGSAFSGFDFKPALWNELVLKEKDFRAYVQEFDWKSMENKHVYLFCSVDAILPSWAFMLVSSKLVGIAASVTIGDLNLAKQQVLESVLRALDVQEFVDGKIIVKGCSHIPNPESAMSLFLQRVQPVCASIMYGEPCSTVPIYKRPKK